MDTSEIDEATKVETALARLQELQVEVKVTEDFYMLLAPHNLNTAEYIEFGYLMAQLADVSFPAHYAPISERGSQVFDPPNKFPNVTFAESYPSYMKFRVYRLKQNK